jgi:hypothetical protein
MAEPVRLREILEEYANFPASVRTEVRDTPPSQFTRLYFGLGMTLRNKFLWHRDNSCLIEELRLIRDGVANGQRTFRLADLEETANIVRPISISNPDDISLNLIHILHDIEAGEVCFLDW